MARKTSTNKADHVFALISREKLLGLYADLLQCRMIEETLGTRRTPGREASAVAVAGVLVAGDDIIAPSRNPLPGFLRAKKRDEALAAWRKASRERQPTPVALLKAALTAARRQQGERKQGIVAVFAAEAWVKIAAWEASLQAAATERLPILFVAPGPVATSGTKLGFPAMPVDRDDVVGLYRVASESAAHARRGNGATLIECTAWEFAAAGKGSAPADNAIVNMEQYLAHAGIEFARTKARVTASFRRRLHAVKSSK